MLGEVQSWKGATLVGLLLWCLLAAPVSAQLITNKTQCQTTVAGAPIDNLRNIQTVGPRGPALLQDFVFMEQIQIMNREKIPERLVHARGVTAKGYLNITSALSDLTTALFAKNVGTVSPITVRFSQVLNSRSVPEFLRDIRGFALKIYTQEGNYDIVSNAAAVFFTRDGIRFMDTIRALRANPKTNQQEWWRIWDYFVNFPESVNAFTWLMDDIGIPFSLRHVDGFSINTFKFIDRHGRERYFRWHFRSALGQLGIPDELATEQNFQFHTQDLLNSITSGNFPKWDLEVQVIDPAHQPTDFDPLDATKDWPPSRFPYRKVGEFVLNEAADEYFFENEQVAFAPSRLVPGIVPSDDKLLQARLVAYFDNQIYRLGVNNQMLPINAPRCPFRDNHVDGLMNFRKEEKGNQEINFFPSATDQTIRECHALPKDPETITGQKVKQDPPTFNVDEFKQPGERLRSFDAARRQRFADRVALALSGKRTVNSVRNRWVQFWTQADKDIGDKILSNLNLLLHPPRRPTPDNVQQLNRLTALKQHFTRTGPTIV